MYTDDEDDDVARHSDGELSRLHTASSASVTGPRAAPRGRRRKEAAAVHGILTRPRHRGASVGPGCRCRSEFVECGGVCVPSFL